MESVNFDRAASFYDATRALPVGAMRELTSLLAAELALRSPCLEIGVGTGRFALALRDRGIAMAGADISGAMLRRLVANAGGRPPLPLVQADATRLPVAAGTFGSVLAVHVLHLIPDWRIAVDEAARVLRPGGTLLASFPTDNRAAPDTGLSDTGLSDTGLSGPSLTGRAAEAGAPWSAALGEAARRHGMVRRAIGARDPQAVAAYLGSRATARELEPVTYRTVTTLGETLSSFEQQLFSWTWPYSAGQAAAVAAAVRDWAERTGLPLSAAHESLAASRWWAFDLTL
ncbi:MAG TPA: class I SAM-dependent methyltransferase [Trebonia sp.]|nr:class I SAM-dependent methyltransferase [Trebonia sp.]